MSAMASQITSGSIVCSTVCQTFSLLDIRLQRPWFESCIGQRKTTCLLSIWKSLACTRASKLTTTNMYIARARYETRSSIAHPVWQQAFCLLEIGFQGPWVRILHSTEEDNLSAFQSKIVCKCQSIHINNNKHVYSQNQVREPIGSGVEWTECSLIIEIYLQQSTIFPLHGFNHLYVSISDIWILMVINY